MLTSSTSINHVSRRFHFSWDCLWNPPSPCWSFCIHILIIILEGLSTVLYQRTHSSTDLTIKCQNTFKGNSIYLCQPELTFKTEVIDLQIGSEKDILKKEKGCFSIFCRSTSSLHRNVHTNSLDSSYCFPNHFLNIHSLGICYSEQYVVFLCCECYCVHRRVNYGLRWICLLWSTLDT